ncbi:GTP-binding protein, partial [archaeon]|nr:GTP-binding protein [archaeon]
MIRQPLVVVMGNIDSGKTRTLDTIRRTAVVDSEAGAITQMISSSAISFKTIEKVAGHLLKNQNITLPGLIFLDTPGHAAFSNMRKRGGNLADIAILVIDINEGIKPQTKECIEVLKKYKTPFLISLNKIDKVPGWQDNGGKSILQMIEKQADGVQQNIQNKLYEIVGELFKFGFQAERFDRIDDYTKQIALVPCSGKFGQGIPELLAVLI